MFLNFTKSLQKVFNIEPKQETFSIQRLVYSSSFEKLLEEIVKNVALMEYFPIFWNAAARKSMKYKSHNFANWTIRLQKDSDSSFLTLRQTLFLNPEKLTVFIRG